MAIDLCGIALEHPVINGSGTFDVIAARRVFGEALDTEFPFAAFVSKTITLEPRLGNPPPRLFETASGLINSIGLPNRGLAGYLEHDLPELSSLPVPLITNVMGSNADEVGQLFEALEGCTEIAAIELNVSCPNVKTGLDIGSDPAELSKLLGSVRSKTSKPLIVKLTPNTANVALVASAAEASGADAVSLINTLRAFAADPSRPGKAWLGGGTGGQSGPAIRSVALAQTVAVSSAVSLPIVAMGGISTAANARQFLDAGALIIAVGTESFRDPATAAQIRDGLVALS
ncbi:MAG: dihydroorotate dehydrogenase [Actinomycetes bacterium]